MTISTTLTENGIKMEFTDSYFSIENTFSEYGHDSNDNKIKLHLNDLKVIKKMIDTYEDIVKK